jgi:hypothetical protein
MAVGVWAAQAPLVAFTEDHVYPDPGWAAALIKAFEGPWAAVGSMLTNANPGALSEADMLLNFGPWIEPGVAGEMARLAPHNTAYRRDVLLRYGTALAGLLESEVVLHRDLVARGDRLYFEPSARLRHVNVGRWDLLVNQQFFGGQMFGASRAQYGGWSWRRRGLYIAAAPLIPPLRLARLVRERRQRGWGNAGWRIWPPLVAGLWLHTLGEALGYATGMGVAIQGKAQAYHGRIQDITQRAAR